MKHYIKNNKIEVILVSITFILFISLIGFEIIANNKLKVQPIKFDISIKEKEQRTNANDNNVLNNILKENENTIMFLAKTFQIDNEVLITKLKEDYKEIKLLETPSIEKTLIDYLFSLEKSNKKLFSKKVTACKDTKEYMVALIKYYTNIYTSVDFEIAAAIAQIESNYSSSGMLKRNNIFGGMSGSGSLIKYRNIEYGILKYIELLNDGYFSKGLTTIEEIGKKYNPVYINGVKKAKPVWVTNVTNATSEFKEYKDIDIETIASLKNNK